ncbi:MAG: hypothetical protein PVTTEEND_000746 [Candidatus Fervidibacter sp.]
MSDKFMARFKLPICHPPFFPRSLPTAVVSFVGLEKCSEVGEGFSVSSGVELHDQVFIDGHIHLVTGRKA